MANPTQAQIDKLTTNLTRWDSIVNGSSETTVSLDSHTVNTVTYYLQQLKQLTATNPRGAWGTTTVYALKDVVVESSVVYICTIAHTSGTFSTDLAAGKWAVYQLDVTSPISFVDNFTVDTNVFHVNATNNKVGIGTTSPSELLEVKGISDPTIFINAGTHAATTVSTASLKFGYVHSGGSALGNITLTEDSQNSFDGTLKIGVPYNNGQGGSSTRNVLYLKSTGSIGINTDSPRGQIDIRNSSGTSGFIVSRGASNSNPSTQIKTDSSKSVIENYGDLIFSIASLSGSPSEKMRFDTNGQLGIGTNSPSATLDIKNISLGNENALSIFRTQNNSSVQVLNYTLGADADRTGLYFELQGVNNTRMWMDDASNLLIKTSTPTTATDGTVVGTQTSMAITKNILENGVDHEELINEIKRISLKKFKYKNEEKGYGDKCKTRIGFIADELYSEEQLRNNKCLLMNVQNIDHGHIDQVTLNAAFIACIQDLYADKGFE
jgi:hypothetical protein